MGNEGVLKSKRKERETNSTVSFAAGTHPRKTVKAELHAGEGTRETRRSERSTQGPTALKKEAEDDPVSKMRCSIPSLTFFLLCVCLFLDPPLSPPRGPVPPLLSPLEPNAFERATLWPTFMNLHAPLPPSLTKFFAVRLPIPTLSIFFCEERGTRKKSAKGESESVRVTRLSFKVPLHAGSGEPSEEMIHLDAMVSR
ncbi:hypothetical protein TGARI_222155 [Toxoplasma gondii ARI]|uniref:Uncharacterized protein n=1 Tax=Toxoplasma gondii ARI TaxID=1074872 RepID=A0A139XUY6_TOXGO|nr:hypothetical protein TGARI_222155 [Toxoplasma gondii ARI]